MDAGNYTNDTGQSVYMVAENIVGGMYYGDILILNNVRPDVFLNFYVLQNGTVYPRTRVPYIAYTSTSYGYIMQSYNNAPYGSGRTYHFNIDGNLGWYMCAYDIGNFTTYTCILESSASGNTLKADLNTSVWAENYNTIPGWWNGFQPIRFKVYGAKMTRGGSQYDWSSEHQHTSNACSNAYPAIGVALRNTLVAAGKAKFSMPDMPLYC